MHHSTFFDTSISLEDKIDEVYETALRLKAKVGELKASSYKKATRCFKSYFKWIGKYKLAKSYYAEGSKDRYKHIKKLERAKKNVIDRLDEILEMIDYHFKDELSEAISDFEEVGDINQEVFELLENMLNDFLECGTRSMELHNIDKKYPIYNEIMDTAIFQIMALIKIHNESDYTKSFLRFFTFMDNSELEDLYLKAREEFFIRDGAELSAKRFRYPKYFNISYVDIKLGVACILSSSERDELSKIGSSRLFLGDVNMYYKY